AERHGEPAFPEPDRTIRRARRVQARRIHRPGRAGVRQGRVDPDVKNGSPGRMGADHLGRPRLPHHSRHTGGHRHGPDRLVGDRPSPEEHQPGRRRPGGVHGGPSAGL
ncbi:hypothetical protein LTR94_028411, partial [Friedmanniomyces endolithicus]